MLKNWASALVLTITVLAEFAAAAAPPVAPRKISFSPGLALKKAAAQLPVAVFPSSGGGLLAVSGIDAPGREFRYQPVVSQLDAAGMLLWSKEIVAGAHAADFLNFSMYATALDDGFLIVGTRSVAEVKTPIVYKVDAKGLVVWRREYPTEKTTNGYVVGTNAGPNGTALVLVLVPGSLRVLTISATGALVRSNAFPLPAKAGVDISFQLAAPSPQGGFVVLSGGGFGNSEALCLSATGTKIWSQSFPGKDTYTHVAVLRGGHLLFAGYRAVPGNDLSQSPAYAVTDMTGKLVGSTQEPSPPGMFGVQIGSLTPTAGGAGIVSGQSPTAVTSKHERLAKITVAPRIEWEWRLDEFRSSTFTGQSASAPDGNGYVFGFATNCPFEAKDCRPEPAKDRLMILVFKPERAPLPFKPCVVGGDRRLQDDASRDPNREPAVKKSVPPTKKTKKTRNTKTRKQGKKP